MGEQSRIGWTDHTWSPWHGCAKVSPGCVHCYAESMSRRNPGVLGVWGPSGTRVISKGWDRPLRWQEQAQLACERIRVFPSICDPFEDREDLVEPRLRFFGLIDQTPNLDWLVLTKRPENIMPILERSSNRLSMVDAWLVNGDSPSNLWLGISCEDQIRADERIPILLSIPAAVRWVSAEPLLGPVEFDAIGYGDQRGLNALTGEYRFYREDDGEPSSDWGVGLDWIVVGGESGPAHRPFQLDWLVSVVDQCRLADVPCYVKQDAALRDGQQGRIPDHLWAIKEFPATREDR